MKDNTPVIVEKPIIMDHRITQVLLVDTKGKALIVKHPTPMGFRKP